MIPSLSLQQQGLNRDHHEFLPPDAELVHASVEFALLAFSGDFTKQNKNKTKLKTTISVHEFLSDSVFDYSIMLLFDVQLFNNSIFLFYRFFGRTVRWRLHLK